MQLESALEHKISSNLDTNRMDVTQFVAFQMCLCLSFNDITKVANSAGALARFQEGPLRGYAGDVQHGVERLQRRVADGLGL